MAPPGRLVALHDAPPPSSPEFSIRKPYPNDGPQAKGRRSSRVVRTYSERPRRLPILPPSLQRLRGLEVPLASNGDLPSSSSIPSDPITSGPAEPASFLSSPPSSPPPLFAPEVKLRRSPGLPSEPERVPLAPIFLSLNRRWAIKNDVKEEVDTKEAIRGRMDFVNENRGVKREIIKSERQPTPDENGDVKMEMDNSKKSEPVFWKHEHQPTRIVKDEHAPIKPEPQVKKEWPIFSFAAMARQGRSTLNSEVQPEFGQHEGKDIKPRFKQDPNETLETPVKQEGRIKRERTGSCRLAGSPSTRTFVGFNDISPKDVNIKDEIVVKVEPVQLRLGAHVKVEQQGSMSGDEDPIKHEPSFDTSFRESTRSVARMKSEPFIKDELTHLPLPPSSFPVKKEESQLDQQGIYNLSYKHYVNASRQQAASSASSSLSANSAKKKSSSARNMVQTTLNLSTKLPFKECKLCDTMYNPLHPADVKLHQEMHDRAVRSSGWAQQNSSSGGGRKRKRSVW